MKFWDFSNVESKLKKVETMYKIIIVEDTNQSYKELVKGKQHNIEYVKKEELDDKLRREEYDIIYLPREIGKNELINKTLNDYEVAPTILKKLYLNNDYITLTNIQLINKLILDNINIIQFKNNFEATLIAYKIRKKLTNETYLVEKYLTQFDKIREYITLNLVIARNYSGKSIWRILKYLLNQKKIQKLFFEKIENNIKNDIQDIKK